MNEEIEALRGLRNDLRGQRRAYAQTGDIDQVVKTQLKIDAIERALADERQFGPGNLFMEDHE